MAKDIQNWNKVAVSLNSKDSSPIKTYRDSCAWLMDHAQDQWLHESVFFDKNVDIRVTYWIKDPKIALLFKLTWA